MFKFNLFFTTFVLSTEVLAAQPFESINYKIFNQNPPQLEHIGYVRTYPSGQVDAQRWSIGYECVDRGYAKYSESGSYIGQLGVGHARIQSGWARTETRKGKYGFILITVLESLLPDTGIISAAKQIQTAMFILLLPIW